MVKTLVFNLKTLLLIKKGVIVWSRSEHYNESAELRKIGAPKLFQTYLLKFLGFGKSFLLALGPTQLVKVPSNLHN